MYLGRLRGLLSSAQVSQAIPQVQPVGQLFELNSMIIPSRGRTALKGTATAFHTLIYEVVPNVAPSLQKNDKINMVTLSFSALSTTFWPKSLAQACAVANSGTAGYRIAGYDRDLATETTTIYKLAFSNEAVSTVSATLSGTQRGGSTCNNNGTAGYVWVGALGTLGTAINKLLYSNDTRSTLGATMTSSRYSAAGASNSGTAGYTAGGEV